MTALNTTSSSGSTTPESSALNVSAAIERQGQLAALLYDPATLLIDTNARGKAKLTKRFLDSIRSRGILVPVIAVRTAEGATRVRMGHRRTLAALEVGRQVPVIVVGDEGTDDAATIERILDQFAENEGGREGLSTRDHVGAAEELALFGMPAAEISRNLHMPRKQVTAALNVARSPLAKAAAERNEFLTIPQAAVLAEFEDDTETVKALVVAAKTGDFDQIAQIARDEREDRQARTVAEQALTQGGTQLLDQGSHGGKVLTSLTDDQQTLDPITAEAHTRCPGHGAYLTRVRVDIDHAGPTGQPGHTGHDGEHEDGEPDEDGYDKEVDGYDDPETRRYKYKTVHVCTKPGRHHPRYQPAATPTKAAPKAADMDPAEREEAARERREVVKLNKEWESAQKVRLTWLADFAGRQRAPKGTSALLAKAMTNDGDVFADVTGMALATKLLGADTNGHGRARAIGELIEKASEQRAQVIHLILVLAMYEAKTNRSDWRPQSRSPRTRRYLQQLSVLTYKLSSVEQRAAADPSSVATATDPTTKDTATVVATDVVTDTATGLATDTTSDLATASDTDTDQSQTMATDPSTGEATSTPDTETPEQEAAA